MATTSKDWAQVPLANHPPKLKKYAEIYAKGVFSKAEAARQAGFKDSVALGRAYEFIGKSRTESKYPVLWDYYEDLRKKNLREFDIEATTIGRELALIAFSDLTRFVDLPRKEYEVKARLALETEAAVNAIQSYPDRMTEYTRELSAYDRDCEKQDHQKAGRKKKLIRPTEPERPTERENFLYETFRTMNSEERTELMIWRNYRAGSIRLKNREEIPESLLPALAEVSETRDGIRIKLHDKISALDKLARWKRMYEEEKGGEGGEHVVKEINIVVNGSKSTLKISGPEPEEKTAA